MSSRNGVGRRTFASLTDGRRFVSALIATLQIRCAGKGVGNFD
jgi:hypothetical protein